QISEVRRILTGLGLFEAQGQTLISEAGAKLADAEGLIALANPLSSDMNALRPSLVPGLLDSLRHNLSHKNYDVALFEIGRVFSQPSAVRAPTPPGSPAVNSHASCEERHLAIALTGQRNPLFWRGEERDARFDIFDL